MVSALPPFLPISGPDNTSAAGPVAGPLVQPRDMVAESVDGGQTGHRQPDDGAGSFLHAAGNMVTDALASFREAAGRAFGELGLDKETIAGILASLVDPIRNALDSGGSFVADLMFATVSQQSLSGPAGASGGFDLVARSLRIEVNHATGNVSIQAKGLEIDMDYSNAGYPGGGSPKVMDMTDGSNGLFPDLVDELIRILDSAEQTRSATDAEAAPSGVTRRQPQVTVQSFEQFLNALGERMSRIRLDAVIPLAIRQVSEPRAAPPAELDGSIVV